MNTCLHCGEKTSATTQFCCSGCETAYQLIKGMGLSAFYHTRTAISEGELKPEDTLPSITLDEFIHTTSQDHYRIDLMIDGLQCASCVWLIEHALQQQKSIIAARLNMSTHRLTLTWQGNKSVINDYIHLIYSLGYRALPFDSSVVANQDEKREKSLLWSLAVAGFAAGNIMLISVALWSSTEESMGLATRELFYWLSALIALPAIAFSGRPFFSSAWQALIHKRANMDVPISLALLLACGMSMAETIQHGEHIYFDSAIMLLFFLLIGRYLDLRTKGKARQAAQRLIGLLSGSATIIDDEGKQQIVSIKTLAPGMHLAVAMGEKIAADGIITQGETEIDTSLITGESIPRTATCGSQVFAGTVNLNTPIEVEITHAGEQSLLAEIVRLMEKAEQGQAKYTQLSDKVAKLYTPVVHSTALLTFLGWWLGASIDWQPALLNAITVLIITCPCALALAVPAVQVIASSQLMRSGIIIKQGDALERLYSVSIAVFDKTGTLTSGKPSVTSHDDLSDKEWQYAASLASHSRHPLSQSIYHAYNGDIVPLSDIKEIPGKGISAIYQDTEVRLGNKSWCEVNSSTSILPLPKHPQLVAQEVWFKMGNAPAQAVLLSDQLRVDAEELIKALALQKIPTVLLSGDRQLYVKKLAEQLDIPTWQAEMTPVEKCDYVTSLQKRGYRVLMVGDGLNDAAALVAADVSMSPSSAMDITQNAASIIFQGKKLAPVWHTLMTAKATHRLITQNIGLAIVYNAIAIPAAILGYVTPLVAAVAMSASSLLVISNALRLPSIVRKKIRR
jgi:Cu2+-exporting ATPase